MTAPARTAAYHALRAIADERADLPAALAQSRRHLPDERDRALAAEIVTGTLRWQRSLDYLAEHFAARPLAKIDRDVLHILRLSLYQLLHLDRVPASAVVDDAVDLARQAQESERHGFRQRRAAVAAAQAAASSPAAASGGEMHRRDAALAYLGITHSHPEWLVARWFDRYGFEATERWVQFNNDTPQMTLRVNTLRSSRDEVAACARRGRRRDRADAPRTCTASSSRLAIRCDRPRADGSFFVQDEASQLVSLAVAAAAGRAGAGSVRVARRKDRRDGRGHARLRAHRRLRRATATAGSAARHRARERRLARSASCIWRRR